MTTHPKILFLMDDQHRADFTGYEGHPCVRTPVLDELARTGVVFRNCYSPSPICVPARMCMMAGQLPRTAGCEVYGDDLPPFSMTFARRFAQVGYQTTTCGKLHHIGADTLQGWRRLIGMHENADHWLDPDRDEDLYHRYAVAPRKGTGWDPVKEVQRAGVGRARPVDHDEYAIEGAIRFINEHFVNAYYDRPMTDRPLLLKISLESPHIPFQTDEAKFTYYLNRVEPYIDQQTFDHPFLGKDDVVVGRDISERDYRRAHAAYCGMIETLDNQFGRVMAELERVGEDLDEWTVVFCSDHGDMMGEHNAWWKQVFFEGSARVPLIIRPSKQLRDAWGCEGRVVKENVNLCDLFATLCDLAGVDLPADEKTVGGRGLDSRSMVPLMQGHCSAWHERYHDETISQFGGTNLMIKRGSLKYQWYERDDCRDQPEVLFDLEADPAESRNLISESRYAAALETLRERRSELGFGPNAKADYRNAGYR